MKSLLIDNYDSFTYNLFQMLSEINDVPPIVIKNNEMEWEELLALGFDNVVISPGPGHPDKFRDFGIGKRVILESAYPVLGVCLGHQGIYSAFGGKIKHAPVPMHGRISKVLHEGKELFHKIPREFNAVRYHSLVGCAKEIPVCLEITAKSTDGLIMAIRHKERPIWGVQFHPESICTDYGYQLLENFKNLTESFYKKANSRGKKCNFSENNPQHNTSSKMEITNKYVVKVRELVDFYEPEQVFEYLFKDKKNSAWLDSSKVIDGFSRFSFMGCADGPLSYSVKYDVSEKQIIIEKNGREIRKSISIFAFLKQELAKFAVTTPAIPFNFNGGFIGYLGYELKSETCSVENRFRSGVPDAQFLFLDRVIAFDHLQKKCYLLVLTHHDCKDEAKSWFDEIENKIRAIFHKAPDPKPRQPSTLAESHFSRDYETYINDINKCLAYIKDGDSYEICLTNKIKFNYPVNPYQYYLSLRQINPAPYAAFLNFDNCSVASSSLERYLYIDTDGNVETKPIKGTLPRGNTVEEDNNLIHALKNDEKFRSENLMIVDLLRNDLGTVCEIGTVHVPHLMEVESYQSVHQLVSTIRGKLKADKDSVDCIKATFPGGSMTGAPKIRTMNIIDTLENEARGIYSGAIGFLALNGSADFNIVIRTAIITPQQLSIGIGGAIISLSDPEEEYKETLLKANLLQRALEACHTESNDDIIPRNTTKL